MGEIGHCSNVVEKTDTPFLYDNIAFYINIFSEFFRNFQSFFTPLAFGKELRYAIKNQLFLLYFV